jgi:hypothetical protein
VRKLKIKGELLASPSAITVLVDGHTVFCGLVGVGFPLFTDIDLCICDVDLDPAVDQLIELKIQIDVGVVKIGPPTITLGKFSEIKGSMFDTKIDTVDGKWYGVASDFRQEIFIDNVVQESKQGWYYEVNAKQVFKQRFLCHRNYSTMIVIGEIKSEKIDSVWR